MQKLIVFGTYHNVQGIENAPCPNVIDPDYKISLQRLLKHYDVDWIFEEACGFGPSVASGMVPIDRYVDIDSETTEEEVKKFAEPIDINSNLVETFPPRLNLPYENLREERWVEKIKAEKFKSGLVICGVAHLLSISFRLRGEGFDVQPRIYEPIERLCPTQVNCPKLHFVADKLCETRLRLSKKFKKRPTRDSI